ncbi:MAG: outer membrane beta-barrel protein [Bdellovibrio sp.]
MKFFTMAGLVLLMSWTAEAQTRRTASTASYGGAFTHEITTNLTNGVFVSGKECKDCSTGSVVDIGGSYLRYWKDNMQYGVEGRLQNLSKEASAINKSATRIDLLAIGTYNLTSDLKDAIYGKAGVGIYSVINNDGDDYENKFGFFVGAGKRFSWLNNISYTPELRLVKRGDIDIAIQVDLLNFSIYW